MAQYARPITGHEHIAVHSGDNVVACIAALDFQHHLFGDFLGSDEFHLVDMCDRLEFTTRDKAGSIAISEP